MKVLIVNNPRSGQGDAALYDYVSELHARGAEVTLRPLAQEDRLSHALRDAEDYDRVVASGGDSTVAAAAHHLRGTGIPLLAYPAGTANLIALNLGMPIDPARLAETTLAGHVLRADLGELTYAPAPEAVPVERRRLTRPNPKRTTGFTGIAGAGFDAEIMERARGLKDSIGAGAYLVGAIQIMQPTVARITMDLDGRRVETEGSAVLLVNFARIQFDLSVTHDSDGTDGLLEVVVIKARYMTDLLPVVMAAALDRIVDFPDRTQVLDTYRARRIDISAEPALPLQADGETLGASTPFSARVLPLASTFLVPA